MRRVSPENLVIDQGKLEKTRRWLVSVIFGSACACVVQPLGFKVRDGNVKIPMFILDLSGSSALE